MMTMSGREGSSLASGCSRSRVLLVIGMSGAARLTALKTLEEAFDNLPVPLIPALIENVAADSPTIAVGADARTRGFAIESMLATLDDVVGRTSRELKLVFIDCDDDRLERRYTQSRRPHPLAGDRLVIGGIRLERQVLSALRDCADLVIDTSNLTATELKRLLTGYFALGSIRLRVFVISFSYRQGIPRDADLIFDVRFLDNPHYVSELRPLTGRDPRVAAHIEADPGIQPFLTGLWQLLEPLLPRYEKEGKTYLTIGIGCTGGRHRSVYVAERLAGQLLRTGFRVELSHRDLPLSGSPGTVSAGAPAFAN